MRVHARFPDHVFAALRKSPSEVEPTFLSSGGGGKPRGVFLHAVSLCLDAGTVASARGGGISVPGGMRTNNAGVDVDPGPGFSTLCLPGTGSAGTFDIASAPNMGLSPPGQTPVPDPAALRLAGTGVSVLGLRCIRQEAKSSRG